MRAVAAVQPTDRLHLGNYFGAVAQSLRYQDIVPRGNYCFVADYHAQASTENLDKIQERTRSLAIDFLSLGLRPGLTHIYRQADIAEVMEVTWLLSLFTPHGMLERGHKIKNKLRPTAAVYLYPLLMAADVLGLRATHVPVGEDQKQHVDRARDIAENVNKRTSGQRLPVPKGVTTPYPRLPGTNALDPRFASGVAPKMSKSEENFIPVFCSDEDTDMSVASIATRPIEYGQPIDVEGDTVFTYLRLFLPDAKMKDAATEAAAGRMGYDEAKRMLAQAINDFFREARTARMEWETRVDDVEDILREGAAVVRTEMTATLEVLRECTGLKAFRRFSRR